MTSRDVAKPIDPGTLEGLGKAAARLGETTGLSLTEAVVQKIASMALSAEQIRRVVEACNIEAVNRKYASLQGPNRIVDINGGPADPVQVLQSVKAAAAPAATRIQALEYSLPPGVDGEKRSSALPTHIPAANLTELRDKLAAAHDDLTQKAEASSFLMEEALESLKLAARSAALEGASLAELYTAWAGHSEVLAKVAAAQLKGSIPWGSADRGINPDHKVMSTFRDFAKFAQRFYQERSATLGLEEQLTRVERALRRSAS